VLVPPISIEFPGVPGFNSRGWSVCNNCSHEPMFRRSFCSNSPRTPPATIWDRISVDVLLMVIVIRARRHLLFFVLFFISFLYIYISSIFVHFLF
jgi:hypothetical protein